MKRFSVTISLKDGEDVRKVKYEVSFFKTGAPDYGNGFYMRWVGDGFDETYDIRYAREFDETDMKSYIKLFAKRSYKDKLVKIVVRDI